MPAPLEFLANHAKPGARVSVILLDWNVRESFHSLQYLNQQTVDRSRYELIWIQFYDKKPQPLLDAVRAGEEAGRPIVDKLVVMNYPRDFIFHKHRMYNLGIVLAEGEICVICDSDAMFTPTFIEKIIAAFQHEPNSVVHLDEVRSKSKNFYPFNYPTIEEVLANPCMNWTGRTTRGLNDSPDMLHEANYGACMAARREDLIRIGGSDEHLDYLGYICGPYELTFRLVNAGCKERWLQDEFLYHTWHPGESEINIDYQGPSDGQGLSSRALDARRSGAVEPGLENDAIRALRLDPWTDRRTALARLESPADEQWRNSVRMSAAESAPRLVVKDFRGLLDIYHFGGCWYGIPTSDEPFDPEKAKSGAYERCLRAHSRQQLESWIPDLQEGTWVTRLSRRYFPEARRLAKTWLKAAGVGFDVPFDPCANAAQVVREGYIGHNIVYFRGEFFAAHHSIGEFDPTRVKFDPASPVICSQSIAEVKERICRRMKTTRARVEGWRQVKVLAAAARAVRPLVPAMLVRILRGGDPAAEGSEPEVAIAGVVYPPGTPAQQQAG
ncbi:MAG: glycosyltransferase [Deltaproteobacteria bacterium]